MAEASAGSGGHTSHRGYVRRHGARMSIALPLLPILKHATEIAGGSGAGSSALPGGASGLRVFSPLFLSNSELFMEKFLGKPVVFERLTVKDVPESIQGVWTLMRRGAWKNVNVLCDRLLAKMAQSDSASPVTVLELQLFKVLFFFKVRSYDAAQSVFCTISEFASGGIVDSISPAVPFSFYVLYAEMTYLRRNEPDVQLAMDCLHVLLGLVRDRICDVRAALKAKATSPVPEGSKKPPTPGKWNVFGHSEAFSDTESALGMWVVREARVIYSLCNLHMSLGQVPAVLCLLRELLAVHPGNPFLFFQIACVYLQMGSLTSATALFGRMEKLLLTQPCPETQHLLALSRGYLAAASRKYEQAVTHFDAAMRLDSTQGFVAAVASKALCLLLLKQHARALRVLEEFIKAQPVENLQAPVIINLCGMYTLLHDGMELSEEDYAFAASGGVDGSSGAGGSVPPSVLSPSGSVPPPPYAPAGPAGGARVGGGSVGASSSVEDQKVNVDTMSVFERTGVLQKIILRFADDDFDPALVELAMSAASPSAAGR